MANPEEQNQEHEKEHSFLGDFIKMAVLAWSMAILTANYLGMFKQALDPTFPASLLTGTLASVTGVNIRNKKKEDSKLKESSGNAK